jgi:Thioredoxin domain
MKTRDLTVFVSEHCFNCKESLLIAEQIRQQYSNVRVTVFNVDTAKPHADIFAVPTYTLDGKIAFLGNPTDQQIHELLAPAPVKDFKMAESSRM